MTVALFEHPCEVCAVPDAPFGYEVNLRQGKTGRWRCGAHRLKDSELPAMPAQDAKEFGAYLPGQKQGRLL